ncbi:hypothetical protein CKM354_000307400 [Cercospora kikuchii]|uniref:Zn(2)-C6 fungal-type domain-containing protein n=1 Tax=Cercospora kikuchii TaxID=84275 RepID=A0A9P3C8U0_9PEZI|nr:uncharacterized protein CKM354_000307400 [Cercospora kikuchii]GIZ39699.1 hypothetical protein CKM354_000307400 [Cercospora kikuchii]
MAPTAMDVPARKRTVRACDQCRRRKVKCNGKLGCTECNSIGLECSYGSQIKQSRRRNYLIHLEQKVQRLEHELRSARSTSLPDNTQRRASEPTIELSLATNSNPGVRDYNGTVPEISAPSICYWNNNAYKPFEQHSGSTEWVGPNTTKPFLSGLQIPNQCVQSSDGIYRHDSLSPQTPQTASSATWTPVTDVLDYWQSIPDNTCAQPILPTMPQDAGRWYQHPFDQPLEAHDYHGLSYSNGNMAPCPPSYN